MQAPTHWHCLDPLLRAYSSFSLSPRWTSLLLASPNSYFSLSKRPTLADKCEDRDGHNDEWATAMDAMFAVSSKAGGHAACVHEPQTLPKPGAALCKECKLMAEARLWYVLFLGNSALLPSWL